MAQLVEHLPSAQVMIPRSWDRALLIREPASLSALLQTCKYAIIKSGVGGSLGGSAVWHLPLARGVILETQDRIPRQAPCMEPASPSASLSLSLW